MDQTTGRGIITVVDHNGLQVIFRISTGLAIALPVKCFFVEQPAFQITMVLICFGWGYYSCSYSVGFRLFTIKLLVNSLRKHDNQIARFHDT